MLVRTATDALTTGTGFTQSDTAPKAKTDAQSTAGQSRSAQAKQTLDALLKADKKQRAEAKAEAKRKIEELKERLRMLEQVFRGSPEQMAKAAEQIAKELKAAVKAYGATGGTLTAAESGQAAPQTSGMATGYNEDGNAVGAQPTDPSASAPDDQPVAPNVSGGMAPAQQPGGEVGEPSDSGPGVGTGEDTFKRDVKSLIERLRAVVGRDKRDWDDAGISASTRNVLTGIENDLDHADAASLALSMVPGARVALEV